MQEPYGAYTWYPVNDQPSDKALYDVTVHAPAAVDRHLQRAPHRAHDRRRRHHDVVAAHRAGVVVPRHARDRRLRPQQQHHRRAACASTTGRRAGWRSHLDQVQTAAASIDWIESKLGPYPFDSLGLVVTDSMSAMETQTMVTLGNNDYVLSPAVIAHELVHQWYGDQVSPSDWRDVWLNEGMTMLMQWIYQDEHDLQSLRASVANARAADQALRDEYGPPGDYDPRQFGGSNIYYSPAPDVERAARRARRRRVLPDRPLVADRQRRHLGHPRADLRPLGEGDRPRAVRLLRPPGSRAVRRRSRACRRPEPPARPAARCYFTFLAAEVFTTVVSPALE